MVNFWRAGIPHTRAYHARAVSVADKYDKRKIFNLDRNFAQNRPLALILGILVLHRANFHVWHVVGGGLHFLGICNRVSKMPAD